MGRILKVVLLVAVVIGVAYCGACVYANFIQSDTGEYKIPSVKQAKYEITIRNTRNVFYTDEYNQEGTKIVLYGYWELKDGKYRYNKADLPLDEKIFGEIIIRSR